METLPQLSSDELRQLMVKAFGSVVRRMEEEASKGRAAGLAQAAFICAMAGSSKQRPPYELIGFLEGISDIVGQLLAAAEGCRRLAVEKGDVAEESRWRSLQCDLDFGLARGFCWLNGLVAHRAGMTECPDLLIDELMRANGRTSEVKDLLRQWRALAPEEFEVVEGEATLDDSAVALLAWETIAQTEHLAELAERYPAQLRMVARQVPKWPVLASQRDIANGTIWRKVHPLQLGRDYPLETGVGTRFRAANPMGRYLTDWVERLHYFRLDLTGSREVAKRRQQPDDDAIRRCWQAEGENPPTAEMEAVLRTVPDLPRLTKATSDDWAKRALVPLIMLTDAKTEAACTEPVLKKIWQQKGVKSAATFRSRLLSKVTQTLRPLARKA